MSESTYEYVLEQLQLCKGDWSAVAEATDISKRTIEKIARQEVKDPGVRKIECLATYFRAQQQRAAHMEHRAQT